MQQNPENLVGTLIGNYRLTKIIGQGGFATVYLGVHEHLETWVAIKMLYSEIYREGAESFREEARIVANLIHPHIIRILDFGVANTRPYLIMEHAPGGTMRQKYPKGTLLPIANITVYIQQLADALQFAHNQHIIHRDVKPENMLIDANNQLRLSDFGLAITRDSTLESITLLNVAGTIPYMAPEQLQGKVRVASDQYALGIVAYEWLSGQRPFSGSLAELTMQQMYQPPPSLQECVPGLKREVEQVVFKALSKYPKDRFENVQTFAYYFEIAARDMPATKIVQTQLPERSNYNTAPLASNGADIKTVAPFYLGKDIVYEPNQIRTVPNHLHNTSSFPPNMLTSPTNISWQRIYTAPKIDFRASPLNYVMHLAYTVSKGIAQSIRLGFVYFQTQFRRTGYDQTNRSWTQPQIQKFWQPPPSQESQTYISPIHRIPLEQMQQHAPSQVVFSQPGEKIETPPQTTRDFFIMYNAVDRSWAEWIAWQLEEAGYSVILPMWDFHLGAHFDQEVNHAITQAKRIIAVLSPDYLNARSHEAKWTMAYRRDTGGAYGIFLPVYVRECNIADKKTLNAIVHIDLVGKDESFAHELLLAGVRLERGKPAKAPDFPIKRISHSLNAPPPFPIPSQDANTLLLQQVMTMFNKKETTTNDTQTILLQNMVPKIADSYTRKDWRDVIRKIDLLNKQNPMGLSPDLYRMQWRALLEEEEAQRAREILELSLALLTERSQRLSLLKECVNILAAKQQWEEVARYCSEALRAQPEDQDWLTIQETARAHIADMHTILPGNNEDIEKQNKGEATRQNTTHTDFPTMRIPPVSPSPFDATMHTAVPKRDIEIFYSYSHSDEGLRIDLEKQLSFLRQKGLITSWHDRDISAGAEWAKDIDKHLRNAHIIILLISPDFISSEYCYSYEMQEALQRHAEGKAKVIPVILRPVHWDISPFKHLQVLPINAQPVTLWANQDAALYNVASEIYKVVKELHERK